jgi:hypothetical protein
MNDRGHTNSVPWMHAVCRLRQATFIQTNCVHSWYGVGVTPVIHGTELMRFCKVALRRTKICIKWLWPLNVTLEIIKRLLLVFCWSCDKIPLKWEEKKFPSLQFMNRDRMRLLLTPLRNGRSMPLILSFAGSRIFLYNNIDSILKFQSHTFITFRILV